MPDELPVTPADALPTVPHQQRPPANERAEPMSPAESTQILCDSWNGWNDALGCGAEIGCGLLVLMLGVGSAGTAVAAHWIR